jgi:hypothetical protein
MRAASFSVSVIRIRHTHIGATLPRMPVHHMRTLTIVATHTPTHILTSGFMADIGVDTVIDIIPTIAVTRIDTATTADMVIEADMGTTTDTVMAGDMDFVVVSDTDRGMEHAEDTRSVADMEPAADMERAEDPVGASNLLRTSFAAVRFPGPENLVPVTE